MKGWGKQSKGKAWTLYAVQWADSRAHAPGSSHMNVSHLPMDKKAAISSPAAAVTVAGLGSERSENQTLLTLEAVRSLRIWRIHWNTEYYLCRDNNEVCQWTLPKAPLRVVFWDATKYITTASLGLGYVWVWKILKVYQNCARGKVNISIKQKR